MPKVSVIVPVYNAERFLSRCIESIQKQIEKDIEIILVDDESHDNSLHICQNYAESDERIIVLTKKNGGPHSARKTGINSANSTYIVFADADDWVADTYISSMLEDMNKFTPDCVIGGYTLHENYKNELFLNRIKSGYYGKERLNSEIYTQMLCPSKSFQQNIIPSLCAKLFKLSYLKEVMNSLDEDIRIGEDLSCTYKYLLKSNSIYIDNNITDYIYCIEGESNTNRYDEKYFEKALRSSDFLYKTIDEMNYKFLKENIDRYRLYQLYRQIGILINAQNKVILKLMLKDIKKASQIPEYRDIYKKVNIVQLEIPIIERILLLSLATQGQSAFQFICTLLYYKTKRKRK